MHLIASFIANSSADPPPTVPFMFPSEKTIIFPKLLVVVPSAERIVTVANATFASAAFNSSLSKSISFMVVSLTTVIVWIITTIQLYDNNTVFDLVSSNNIDVRNKLLQDDPIYLFVVHVGWKYPFGFELI